MKMTLIEMQFIYEMRIVQISCIAYFAKWTFILTIDIASILYKYFIPHFSSPLSHIALFMTDKIKYSLIDHFVERRGKSSLIWVKMICSIKSYNKFILWLDKS